MDCPICEYANEHGWWGPNHRGAHCRGCHRSWTGMAEEHCHICHRHFGSGSTSALAHPARPEIDGPTCIDPATVRDGKGQPRLRCIERESGPVWVKAGSVETLVSAVRTAKADRSVKRKPAGRSRTATTRRRAS